MASVAGSSSEAFFCVASRMNVSERITSSSALMDFSRPTNSGTIMCGKTTMSRSGSTGIGPAFTCCQSRLGFGGACHGPISLLLCTSFMTRRMRCHEGLRWPGGKSRMNTYPRPFGVPLGRVRDPARFSYAIPRTLFSFQHYRWRSHCHPVKKGRFFAQNQRAATGGNVGRAPNRRCYVPAPARRSLRRHRRCDRSGRRRCKAVWRCLRPLHARSRPLRRPRGSAARTWCRAEWSP